METIQVITIQVISIILGAMFSIDTLGNFLGYGKEKRNAKNVLGSVKIASLSIAIVLAEFSIILAGRSIHGFGIQKALFKLIRKINIEDSDQIKNIYIVSEIAKKKSKISVITILLLIASILISISIAYAFGYYNQYIIMILSTLTVLAFLNKKILEYRIGAGLFGSNEFESREVIEFILKNQNKYNNTNGKIEFSEKNIEKVIDECDFLEIGKLRYE